MDDKMKHVTYYEMLGVPQSVRSDDLKKAYRKLAIQEHPDKATEERRSEANKKFQKITEAYQTLSDASKRQRYDFQLSHRSLWVTTPPIINEAVDLSEMQQYYEDGQYFFSHSCRCGKGYTISEFDLFQEFDIVSCSGCSLYIQVSYEKEESDG